MTLDNYPDMSYKSGWNPYQPFYPKDKFSTRMLSSIVTKVTKWLVNLNQDVTGEYGELAWNYTPDGGTIIYANESPDRFIQIWWDVVVAFDPEDVGTISICGSDERFQDITINLQFFTAVERSIYGELESLQKVYAERFDSARHLVTVAPPREEEKSAFDLDLEAAQRNVSG